MSALTFAIDMAGDALALAVDMAGNVAGLALEFVGFVSAAVLANSLDFRSADNSQYIALF